MIEIIPFYLIISMFIAFTVLYIWSPSAKIIIKEPTVDQNISKLYVDDNNVCYRYKRTEVKCPINKNI